jgi:hypothetical protein
MTVEFGLIHISVILLLAIFISILSNVVYGGDQEELEKIEPTLSSEEKEQIKEWWDS